MNMSPLMSRAAALTLLFVLLWLGWSGLIAPFMDDISAVAESNAHSTQLLARSRALAADLPSLQRDFEALSGVADAGAFLPIASPVTTLARLQDHVQRLIQSAGGTLSGSRTLPETQESGFSKFCLELDLSADLVTLRHLMVALETTQPFIRIEQLSLQIPESAAVQAVPGGQSAYGVHLQLASFAQASTTGH